MTHGFQQQDPLINFSQPPRSAASPQHGQKPDKLTIVRVKVPIRSFQPRPGH